MYSFSALFPHLRDEHDANSDPSDDIHLQVLTPLISPDPPWARQHHFHPFHYRHSPDPQPPLGKGWWRHLIWLHCPTLKSHCLCLPEAGANVTIGQVKIARCCIRYLHGVVHELPSRISQLWLQFGVSERACLKNIGRVDHAFVASNGNECERYSFGLEGGEWRHLENVRLCWSNFAKLAKFSITYMLQTGCRSVLILIWS